MAKNIILLSDGTGNAASRVWRTNVWRLFQSLDLTTPDQVASYDDGVGTSAFKPLAILGGVFGWGLKRNVIDLYKFLCRNYQPDCQIFGFGFSRGAFTIRILMGLVGHQGVVRFTSETELHKKAKEAYRAYRAERYHTFFRVEWLFRKIRDLGALAKNSATNHPHYDSTSNIEVQSIRFIGVWDTVAAYGMPIDEMTRGVSQWLWPLELPDRVLGPKVKRACHALALDDERTTFHPVLWTEAGETSPVKTKKSAPNIEKERLTQVWFPGVHSNVGGGYPDDSLAHIPLYWMMTQAALCGLRFKAAPNADPDAIVQVRSSRDKDGRLYDSRQGLGGYYRYGPRKIHELCHTTGDDAVEISVPKIHECTFGRKDTGAQVYAPIGLPENYAIVTDDGRILDGQLRTAESADRASRRAAGQEAVWNLVWKRRVIYFLTLAASFNLVLFPLIHQTDKAAEFSTPFRLISETLRLVGAFIPNFFDWWINSFATNPEWFSFGVVVVGSLIWAGSKLGTKITDQMRLIWRANDDQIPPLPNNWIYKLRTHSVYQFLLRAMKRWIVPFFSALLIVYVAIATVSHLLFNIEDAAGLYCEEAGSTRSVPWLGQVEIQTSFPSNHLCWASGIHLNQGSRYQISVTIPLAGYWKDGQYDSGIGGLEVSELPSFPARVWKFVTVPLRRVFLRPWFRIIGRVGSVGADEYFLDPDKPSGVGQPRLLDLSSVLRARRSGELFLYVNDAVIGWPQFAEHFYSNNSGEVKVIVKHLPR